ncbi:MAG: ABC transporter substrate-binding protein [Comamonadaceae bacterium]|nr:MAG: ABC transporter substrate-binding protein [Comamonadaceae bacterium]
MRSDRRRWLLKAGAAAAAASGAWPVAGFAQPAPAAGSRTNASTSTTTITDDLGRQVRLSLPLKRVVVFNRYTTEFIRAIGAMPAVVGVDFDGGRFTDYWPGVTQAMYAGSGQSSPNFEAIVSMRPDAVFMPRNSAWKKAAGILEGFGIPVVVLTGWDLLKHEWNVELLGRLFGQAPKAAQLNAFYRQWRETLRIRLRGAVPRRVYFEEVGDNKTALKGSGWHDMVEAGGGINVFGDISIPGQSTARGNIQNFEVDPEEIQARSPDVIIKLQPGQYKPHPREFSVTQLEKLARRPGLAATPAVKNAQVYHLSYYLASGCSKITGALQIAQWLHPERMAGIDVDAVMGTWLRDFQGVPAQTGYWHSLAGVRR